MAQCKAKSKQSGVRCKKHAVRGKRVCHIHGGLTPGGIASANYKDGRYSKFLPDRLAGRYKEAVNDPTLLELSHEVALLDSRLSDLLKRVDSGEAGHLWKSVKKTWGDLTVAIRSQDADEQQKLGLKLDMLIQKGNDDYEAWNEIKSTIEQRRRLVESERKRLVDAQQYVTAVQAMNMMSQILLIIKDNVTDIKTLSAISSGINQIVSRQNVVDAG